MKPLSIRNRCRQKCLEAVLQVLEFDSGSPVLQESLDREKRIERTTGMISVEMRAGRGISWR